MDRTTQRMMMGAKPPGQILFDVPGTYDFIVGDNVTSLSAVAVQGGKGGDYVNPGAGGHLRWKNDIPVVPGEKLTIVVSAGTAGTTIATPDTPVHSQILRGSTVLLATSMTLGSNGVGGGFGGTPGVSIQVAGDYGTVWCGAGGGGAGGYGGAGGHGGGDGSTATVGTAGLTGGGGGGRCVGVVSNTAGVNLTTGTQGSRGGGVGVNGQGPNGSVGGGPGSNGDGSTYGGGGGAGATNSFPIKISGLSGGNGAVRMIWPAGRAFPSTRTADE